MKRITVSLDDDLQLALERFQAEQTVSPTASAVVVAALREFLASHGTLLSDEEFDIPVASVGSGDPYGSRDHDLVLADVDAVPQ